MDAIEQTRLYLRDQVVEGSVPFFSDEDLLELLKLENDSVLGATAFGWLLKAASTPDAPISMSIGNTSESYGGPTEQYKVCMAMHHHFKGKYQAEQGSDYNVGLWLEAVPDYAGGTNGIVADLMQHSQWLRDYWTNTTAYPE